MSCGEQNHFWLRTTGLGVHSSNMRKSEQNSMTEYANNQLIKETRTLDHSFWTNTMILYPLKKHSYVSITGTFLA